MASSCAPTAASPPSPSPRIDGAATKKRRLRDKPGPDAEVVALSPPVLLGWNRWHGCEACGRGFRRPSSSKLLKREAVQAQARSRRRQVFVCPEPGCPRHAPARALADLPTLQKHFRRKHGRHGLWACGRGPGSVCADCNKAGVNTCGTRTQLEGYVERQDTAGARRPPPPPDSGGGVVLGLAAATSTSQQQGHLHDIAASPCSDDLLVVVSSATARPTAAGAGAGPSIAALGASLSLATPPARPSAHDLDPQLRGSYAPTRPSAAAIPGLDLSLGLGVARDDDAAAAARLMVEAAREQLLLAMAEKAAAEEARAQAQRRAELAGLELASARGMRQQAQVELRRAHVAATRQMVNARLLQVTRYMVAAGSSTPGLPH